MEGVSAPQKIEAQEGQKNPGTHGEKILTAQKNVVEMFKEAWQEA